MTQVSRDHDSPQQLPGQGPRCQVKEPRAALALISWPSFTCSWKWKQNGTRRHCISVTPRSTHRDRAGQVKAVTVLIRGNEGTKGLWWSFSSKRGPFPLTLLRDLPGVDGLPAHFAMENWCEPPTVCCGSFMCWPGAMLWWKVSKQQWPWWDIFGAGGRKFTTTGWNLCNMVFRPLICTLGASGLVELIWDERGDINPIANELD